MHKHRKEREAPPVGVDYVSVQTVARWWGVHEATIREWVRAGRLPATRVGAKLLLHVPSIAAVLDAGRIAGRSRSPQ